VLQCVAVFCIVLPCGVVSCSVLQCLAVSCSVLQCLAVSCCVVQIIAVYCSLLVRLFCHISVKRDLQALERAFENITSNKVGYVISLRRERNPLM